MIEILQVIIYDDAKTILAYEPTESIHECMLEEYREKLERRYNHNISLFYRNCDKDV